MAWIRHRPRLAILMGIALVPLVAVAAFGFYLANLARALPWQEEPTPIADFVTPFANLPTTAVAAVDASPTAAAGAVYTIVGEASEARYVVKETVGRLSLPTEAIGRTNAIQGQLVLDAEGRPLAGSRIAVDLRTLRSGEGQRDNFIQTVTLKDAPLAEFAVAGVQGWTGPLAEGQERVFTIVGKLTLNGVTKEQLFEARTTRTGTTVVGTATSTFRWADFGLKAPNVAAQMISVEETVRIELEVTARAA